MIRRAAGIIYGEPGMGKSPFLDTSPGPRLTLDAEGGSEWIKSHTIRWEPREAPPRDEKDGLTTDTTVLVSVREFKTLRLVYPWLDLGNHSFATVNWDSVTEIQQKSKDAIRGGSAAMEIQDWGRLLDEMAFLVRQFRDLKMHPTNPVNVFFAALPQFKDGHWEPLVQGKLNGLLPSYVDFMGFMSSATTAEGAIQKILQIQPLNGITAKDRTDRLVEKYGAYILLREGRTNHNTMADLCAVLNQETA